MEKEVVVRKDLNEIVDSIGFKTIRSSYGERHVCNCKLWNGVIIEFKDEDNIFGLFQSYIALGDKDFIKTKELIEEPKEDDEGNIIGSYICVKYTLADGGVYRMFARNFNDNKQIDNYYKLYKKTKKSETNKK